MRRRELLLPAALGVLLLAALLFALLAGGGSSGSSKNDAVPGTASEVSSAQGPPAQTSFEGAALPAGRPAPEIDLLDQYGRRVSLAALEGQPVAIAFLYSRCGGPCVLIAQQIRGALDELSRPLAVLIVSADPSGDTPADVRRFLAQVSLSGRVHYLSGSAAQLRRLWREYRVTPASDGADAFASAATVRLIDARGEERVLYGPEQLTPEALAHDARRLQAG
jgi:protein SCO1/2